MGKFVSDDLENKLRQHPHWDRVEYLGFQNREALAEILQSSRVGMATFLPDPNYLYAYPNKIFEYMAAGIPTISSNFPFWEKIVLDNHCGLSVDPQDVKAMAQAVDQILADEAMAQEMGRRGRKAIEEKYNWLEQEKKLVQLYQRLMS